MEADEIHSDVKPGPGAVTDGSRTSSQQGALQKHKRLCSGSPTKDFLSVSAQLGPAQVVP